MDACRSFVCTEIQPFRALSSAPKHHKEPKNSCKSLLFCACGSEYNTHNKVQVTIKHNDRWLHWFVPTYVHEYQTVPAMIYIYKKKLLHCRACVFTQYDHRLHLQDEEERAVSAPA